MAALTRTVDAEQLLAQAGWVRSIVRKLVVDEGMAEEELAARDPASGAELAGTRPAADGSFRFEPLVAREYVVVLVRDGKELDRSAVGPANASGVFLRAR